MYLAPYVISWIVLAAVVGVLAVFRLRAGEHEDLAIHLDPRESFATTMQAQTSRRIQHIEVWGKALTMVAVVYGLVLLALYFYHIAVASVQLPKIGH